MKVFVAIAYFEDDGRQSLIGVFDTPEMAQKACDNHKYKDGELRGDSRSVVIFNMNEAIKVEI